MDSSYYIGITNDLERRLWVHDTGYDESWYTHSRRPVELKYFEVFADANQAIARENKLRVGQEKRNNINCSE